MPKCSACGRGFPEDRMACCSQCGRTYCEEAWQDEEDLDEDL